MSTQAASYEPVVALGHGGMATVQVALRREGSFHRLYAVKRPHTPLLSDPAVRAMFAQEARLAGQIRSPHVVPVLDAGVDDQGPYLVMEYVEGLPASTLLAHAAEKRQELPLRVCLTVALHAARGLEAAHALTSGSGERLPLVHRDISPQNILVGFDGLARVTDFGVAKALDEPGLTTTGLVKGNPGYVSPEALRFEELDARSDLFSLGVVLFELLSGQRLYPARSGVPAAKRILEEPPPDIVELRSDVPPEVVALLFRLLAKDREHRPPGAGEVARVLEEAIVEEALSDEPDLGTYMAQEFQSERQEMSDLVAAAVHRVLAAPPPRAPRPRWRLPAVVIALGAVLAVAAFGWQRASRAKSMALHGLKGEYYAGANFEELRHTRHDLGIAFDWFENAPHESIPADGFSVRWTGYLVPPRTEEKLICIVNDDGARLWIDGKLLVSDWAIHPQDKHCLTLSLRAGHKHPIKIEYFDEEDYAVMKLLWEDPARPGQLVPIPSQHLYRP